LINVSLSADIYKSVSSVVCDVQIIMDRLYKAVHEKVSEGGRFQQALFNYAYEYKKKKFEAGYNTPLTDM